MDYKTEELLNFVLRHLRRTADAVEYDKQLEKYKVIKEDSGVNHFESEIEKYLFTGWKLYGNPLNIDGKICQVLVKKGNETNQI